MEIMIKMHQQKILQQKKIHQVNINLYHLKLLKVKITEVLKELKFLINKRNRKAIIKKNSNENDI